MIIISSNIILSSTVNITRIIYIRGKQTCGVVVVIDSQSPSRQRDSSSTDLWSKRDSSTFTNLWSASGVVKYEAFSTKL